MATQLEKLNNFILKDYTWMYDIIPSVCNNQRVAVDEINLVGGRASGKSVSVQLLFYLLANLDIPIGLVAVRASEKGAEDLFEDFVATLENFNLPFRKNKTERRIYIKNQQIKIVGLNSQSKSKAKVAGFPRFGGVSYIFKYYEERYEFNETDYNAVQEALRGMGQDCQMITINVCNPWAKSNRYIQYCGSYLQWNVNELKTKGSQFKIVEEIDKETNIVTRKLFQYTNWRVAQQVLPKSKIAEIKNVWKMDRNRAQTVDFGLPGYEWGAIYTHLLDRIGQSVINKEPQWIVAGMDYGWSNASTGGKTACVFGTASLNIGVDILGEFIHDPSTKPLGTDLIADSVVKFYIEQMKDYVFKLNRTLPFYCKVRVDNMAVGVITLLNQSARKFRADNWLSFVACAKQPIVDRIDIQQAIMNSGMFRMDKSCQGLLSDFEQAHYKEEVEKRDRAKGSDHVLNAYEYGMEPCFKSFARELTPNTLSRKDRLW